jgi:hypothetical protein
MERDRLVEMPRGYYAHARRLLRFPDFGGISAMPPNGRYAGRYHEFSSVGRMSVWRAVHYEISRPSVIV